MRGGGGERGTVSNRDGRVLYDGEVLYLFVFWETSGVVWWFYLIASGVVARICLFRHVSSLFIAS